MVNGNCSYINDIYGEELDKTKAKGIRGLPILIATLKVLSLIINLAGRSNISQIKLSCVLRRDTSISDSFFSVASVGYIIMIILSVALLIVFLRKMKIYKNLEIVNLIANVIFIGALYYTFGRMDSEFIRILDYLPHGIVFSVINIIYLSKSDIAKNTFVN